MSRGNCQALRISMTTATGARIQAMEWSGYRAWMSAGRHITMDTGAGSNPGDGLGWMTRLGDLRRFTMAVGRWSAGAGAGFLDRGLRWSRPDPALRSSHSQSSGPSTLPRWLPLWPDTIGAYLSPSDAPP